MKRPILILEDQLLERTLYTRILESEGYNVFSAASIKAADDLLNRTFIEVCVIDVHLPDGNGIDFLGRIKEKFPQIEVIVFTSAGAIADGVKAIKNGAFDYIIKGEASEKLISLVSQAMQLIAKRKKHSALHTDADKGFGRIIGESPVISNIRDIGLKVAATSANVLLLGETGVGKDIMAFAIHKSSTRADKDFVAINCSSIGPEMLESELFGYKTGAFTGASTDKKGLFEQAHLGTIFLDEIGEMSLNLQARILRVLENKSFIKLGDTKTTVVDCRLITATNINITTAVKENRFREDLYYRISTFVIQIPPLRERGKDIRLLTKYYVDRIATNMKIEVPLVDESFLNVLEKQAWKGNVRELINVIERAVILCSGVLTPDLIDLGKSDSLEDDHNLKNQEIQLINKVLNECAGNKRKAARKLGISIATLYRKLNEIAIADLL